MAESHLRRDEMTRTRYGCIWSCCNVKLWPFDPNTWLFHLCPTTDNSV